jgi:hypothetical protein
MLTRYVAFQCAASSRPQPSLAWREVCTSLTPDNAPHLPSQSQGVTEWDPLVSAWTKADPSSTLKRADSPHMQILNQEDRECAEMPRRPNTWGGTTWGSGMCGWVTSPLTLACASSPTVTGDIGPFEDHPRVQACDTGGHAI